MQLKSFSTRPLIIGAAASVIVASAVGVAAVAGWIPHSRGQSADAPSERIADAERRIEQADRRTERAKRRIENAREELEDTAVKPAARPAATPRQAPARAAQSKPTQVAQAKPTQVAQATPAAEPKPVAKPGVPGTVVSVREVEVKGDGTGVGAVGGGVAGAVLGRQIGENRAGTIIGGVGGAVVGHHIEKKVRATTHWETSVRLDDGSVQTISTDAQPAYREGERVRVYQGALTPA